jgi:muramoyltetrapeptide carboxypeptidase
VALISPAGPLASEAELERALANVNTMGWEALVGSHALARSGYFAGSDEERAADLHWALTDSRVDGIWCLRGGYGVMRLLQGIDFSSISRNPRTLIGYSDITALHSAFSGSAGMVTFHGPTARTTITTFSSESLATAVQQQKNPCGEAADAQVHLAGGAVGRVLGGNLALLASLVGTPYALSFEGAILLLEDVNEATYRIDRMLMQLLLSGALTGVAGIAFGHCTSCPDSSADGRRTLEEILTELALLLRVPCVSGVPVGHIADQWTVPLGRIAELIAPADGSAASLVVLEQN